MKVLELVFRGAERELRVIRSDAAHYLVKLGKGEKARTVAVSDLVSARVLDDDSEPEEGA